MKKVKLKKCLNCPTEFKQFNSLHIFCSWPCYKEYNKPEKIEQRYNEIKNDARPLSYYEDKARKAFQTWVRLRDQKDGCISCPRKESPQFDGGHYFKAELYSGLIFNEVNCNKQCCYCNRDLHGNLIEYRKGLVLKYGEESVKELEDSADSKRVYKYTKLEYLQIEKHYKEQIKILKQNL